MLNFCGIVVAILKMETGRNFSGVCVCVCFFFWTSSCVLCSQCCQCLCIVYSRLPLLFSLDCLFSITPSVFSGLSILDCPFGFLWIVYSRLPLRFSLDCLFSIAPSVFSNVYFNNLQAIYSDLKEEANYLVKHPVMGR